MDDDDNGTVFYVFALYPEEFQPSGVGEPRCRLDSYTISVPHVLNITATPPARNQSALAVKLGN
jgi:hypothetical protein